MRVTVVGGSGVFGARLCDLLARDGHSVTVAGRNRAKAAAVATRIGGSTLQFDRDGDLSALAGAQAVVDAAGPFHAYGADPYRLAKWCIAAKIPYLDLADDAGFCAGISALDAQARAAGTFALSGVSSVPGLSSIVVADLAQGLDRIDVIETAILPGNRAPRGQSVVDSILHQAGALQPGWEVGAPAPYRGWSRPKRYDLGRGMVRRAYMIGVPDQALFPAFFKARTVWFRAGLELGLMNLGLSVLSGLRRVTGLSLPASGRRALRWAADRLMPFGTDRGGMLVSVTGALDGRLLRRVWRLRAEAGEGPFLPGIVVRAILRDPTTLAKGARPALAELPLAVIDAALADLSVVTDRTEAEVLPVFPAVLGPAFTRLPEKVRASHLHGGPVRFDGRANVTRGAGVLPRLVGGLFGFPPPGTDIPLTVTKTPIDGGEVWLRQFGPRRFRSVLTAGPRGMRERFGPFRFDLGLTADETRLSFPVTGGRFLGMPLPRWALPASDTVETEQDGRFCFDVRLSLPLGLGLMAHYQGWLMETGAE